MRKTIITIITDDAMTNPEHGVLYREIWRIFEAQCNPPRRVHIREEETDDDTRTG